MLTAMAQDIHTRNPFATPLFKKIWLCVVGVLFVGAGIVLIRIERATEDWDYAICAGAAFFIAARLWWVAYLPAPRRKHK